MRRGVLLILVCGVAALIGDDGAFVSDGFGVVHRKQASVYDVAQLLPAYTGGLVLTEVEVLRAESRRRLPRDQPSRLQVEAFGSLILTSASTCTSV